MSELLNNDAFISSCVVGLTSRVFFFIQLQMFPLGFSFGYRGGISYSVYRWFRTMPTPTWFSGKEHCLTGTQIGIAGP